MNRCTYHMKVLISIFNYSVKKISNLKSSFLIIDTSWKNKTPTKTFRMVIYLSKTFLETQSFFIVWNEKQLIFAFLGTGSQKGSCLTAKGLAKLLPRIQKLYQIKYIFCNTVSSVSIPPFDTNWLAPRGTLGLQCIGRAQPIIHTRHLPWNWKHLNNCQVQRKKVFWLMKLHSYLCNTLSKFFITI